MNANTHNNHALIKAYVFINNASRIGSTPFTTFRTSGSIQGKYSETTARRMYKEPTTIKTPTTYSTSYAMSIGLLPKTYKLECDIQHQS
ncbi:hypothetical protein TNCV_4887521 [Trichonephila clavipes]|nr:hypothetical protein TNCV_4887521 [Trichonephila clavipes]